MLLQILRQIDSLHLDKIDSIYSQTNAVTKTMTDISDKLKLNPWIPVISAISGGVLLWIGQHIDRRIRRSYENRDKILVLFSEIEVLLSRIENALKELAINKNRKELWWNCYDVIFEEAKVKGTETELEGRYLDDYHKSADNAIDTELKLKDLLSEYFGKVSTFLILSKAKGIDTNFIKEFQLGANLRDADELPKNKSDEELRELYKINVASLTLEYLDLLINFVTLNSQLKPIAEKYK